MSRYKCTVSYIGANYCGWQSQRKGNSIQEQIESALYKITKQKITIFAAGRTDAKVNAKGQVFHFDCDINMNPYNWKKAVNNFLPSDIRINKVEEVDEHFHARYCALSKRYDYRIHLGEYDVFTKDQAYQCPYSLDVEKMKIASKYFIGTHDFTSFNANPLSLTPDQVRTIYSIDFVMNQDELTISFFGRGFLRYMVRMMSAALIDVGRGKMEPIQVHEMLEEKSKDVKRKNAPAEGLTLMEIAYFNVYSENEETLIRDVIPEDCINHVQYVFANRHSDEIYGYFMESDREIEFQILDQTRKSEVLNQISEFEGKIRKKVVFCK